MTRTPPSLRAALLLERLVPLVAPALLRRRRARGKEDPARMAEKLARPSLPRPEGRLVWLHAVGLGEVLALPALARALQGRMAGLEILITSSTRSSAEALAPQLGPAMRHQYLPIDCPAHARAFLDHWQPCLSVWSERDIWPALVVETHRRGIPQALVNGRMDAASARAKARARGFYAALYGRFSHIGVQEAQTAGHFASLGVHAEVTGRLKAGAAPLPDVPEAHAANARRLAGRRLWLAASTHPGEEALACAAHARLLRHDAGAVLVIAPRQPARGAEALAAARAAGLEAAILPAHGHLPEPLPRVAVVARVGQMGLWFRLADAAFMGGSVAPVGGHNPFEPARLDCAILHGPNIANFAEDYAAFTAAGAALRVADAGALAEALADPGLATLRPRAAAVAAAGAAALEAEADRLVALIGDRP
ncbi:MAG: 3-deoxy-D-manno-octulosonic acid transferase [Alkalilacustris sp.]